MPDDQNNLNAFTLMEIMIVVIIIGVIAGLSIPNYYRASERSYMHDAMTKLRMIHKAQAMHQVKYGEYFGEMKNLSDGFNLDAINGALNLSIDAAGFEYWCYDNDFGEYGDYECAAFRDGNYATYDYRVVLTQNPLSDNNNPNPRCDDSGSARKNCP